MAILPNVFRPSEVTDTSELLPDGEYVMQVTKSSIKDTKAGTGKYISFVFTVLEPEEHAGRMVFNNMNIVNPNPVAVKIAQEELKALTEACGIEELEDTAELHAIPFRAQVITEAGKNGYKDSNKVKKYLPE